MTDDLVKQAREAVEGTTEGPWQYVESISQDGQECYGCAVFTDGTDAFAWLEGSAEDDIPNARFIAASRQLVPAMADALEAKDRRIRALSAALIEALIEARQFDPD